MQQTSRLRPDLERQSRLSLLRGARAATGQEGGAGREDALAAHLFLFIITGGDTDDIPTV